MKQIVISTSQLKKINEATLRLDSEEQGVNGILRTVNKPENKKKFNDLNNIDGAGESEIFVNTPTVNGQDQDDKPTVDVDANGDLNSSIMNANTAQAINTGRCNVKIHGNMTSESNSKAFSKKSIEEARLRKMRNEGVVMTKSELKESFFQEDTGNLNRFSSKIDQLKTNRIVRVSKDRNNNFENELEYYSNDGYTVRILTTGEIISSLMPNGKAGTSMSKREYFSGKGIMDFDKVDIRRISAGNIPQKLLVADSSVARTISRFVKYLADNISYLSNIDETIKHPRAWMCRNGVKSDNTVSHPNFLIEWEERPNDDINQWNEEFEMFMDGLKRGDYIEDGDTVHVEVFKGRTNDNDPRYVSYRKGSDKLQDDHFYLYNSPSLSIKQMKDIYFELGWDSSELDDQYGQELYESEIKIKKKNKGKFNATKKRTGKSTEELTHSKNPITKKRAIFAQNAKKWKKKKGKLNEDYDNLRPEDGYRIGFTDKYFTLWNCRKEVRQIDQYRKETYYRNEYIKNISMSKEKTFEKYPDLPYDESLKGHTRSFDTQPKEEWTDNTVFRFGKYKYQHIEDVDDIPYIAWYFDNVYGDHKDYVGNILKQHGYRIDNFDYGTYLRSPEFIEAERKEEEEKREIEEKLKNHENIEFTPTYNLSCYGYYRLNNNLYLHFEGIKEMYYNGYNYYLPTINGKAKKIKGKTVVITDYDYFKVDEKMLKDYNPDLEEEGIGEGAVVVNVKTFEIH